MLGLKDDETSVGELYEDCKSFIKINPSHGNFQHAPMKFILDRVVPAVEFKDDFRLTTPAIDSNR